MISDNINRSSVTPGTAPERRAATAAVPAPQTGDTQQAEVETAEAQQARLEATVSKLNEYAQTTRRTLSFSIAEATGRPVIKVYDTDTSELIRQIPSENALKLAELAEELSANMLIQERA